MPTAEEEILALVYANYNYTIMAVAATALIVYEETLMMGEVYKTICQRRAISSILLGLNQIFLLLFSVFNILDMLPWTTAMSCEAIDLCWNILITALVMISTVITALRVHVISGGNWRLVAPTLILGIASIFIYIGITFHDSSYLVTSYPTSPSFIICAQLFSSSEAGFNTAMVIPFICTFSSDVMVILVTWTRMRDYGHPSGLFSRTSALRPRLARLLLLDGTLYFIVISLLNIAGLVSNVVFNSPNFLMFITIPMSSILITRFLIDVREAAYMTTIDSSSTRSFIRSRDISRTHQGSELPTITFVEPERTASPQTSLQMDLWFADTEVRPGPTCEWDDISEEHQEGVENDRDEVEMQVMGTSNAVDDPNPGHLRT